MSARAALRTHRRGSCPGLSAPMPTGDGLLARFLPIGTIPLPAFVRLCAAARAHGNGVIEITSRGSIQVRGLSAASVPQFAADIAALNIAADDGVPILTNPLAGLDAEEICDSAALAGELRRALAQTSLAQNLSAKISVAIDGGGALNLDGLVADVRLRAALVNKDEALRVSIGGDGTNAVQLGLVTRGDSVEAVVRLLEVIARGGPKARARDVLAGDGIAVFRSVVADLLIANAESYVARRAGEEIGIHRLVDGTFAYGVGLPFGHANADLLERLTQAARVAGAKGWRAARRTLMVIGFQDSSSEFVADAEKLGFMVRADDPRRFVVACAGAPICASAHIASRAIAPAIAASAAAYLDGTLAIHLSGCAKGCAQAAPAALTVVGTPEGCALVAAGSAGDAPFTIVPVNRLTAAIARFARERTREAGHV